LKRPRLYTLNTATFKTGHDGLNVLDIVVNRCQNSGRKPFKLLLLSKETLPWFVEMS